MSKFKGCSGITDKAHIEAINEDLDFLDVMLKPLEKDYTDAVYKFCNEKSVKDRLFKIFPRKITREHHWFKQLGFWGGCEFGWLSNEQKLQVLSSYDLIKDNSLKMEKTRKMLDWRYEWKTFINLFTNGVEVVYLNSDQVAMLADIRAWANTWRIML